MINVPCKLSKGICHTKFQKKCAMQNFKKNIIVLMRALLFPMYELLFNSEKQFAVYLPAP